MNIHYFWIIDKINGDILKVQWELGWKNVADYVVEDFFLIYLIWVWPYYVCEHK